ncbi:MAG: hypothetical protein LUC45_00970, partial [Paraprevotella sp.]|nr:hypothetical protein [Paraprevotella sp.]
MRKLLYGLWGCVLLSVLNGCSVTKFIPDGEYMLENVTVKSTDKSFDVNTLKGYIRQQPNSKWFSLLKVTMGPY